MLPSTRCSDQAGGRPDSAADPGDVARTTFARASAPERSPLPDALRPAIVAEHVKERVRACPDWYSR